jgi:ribosomal protein S18 acetylase RimI-like enzyme
MIYLKLYEDFENSTFDVKTRYSYTHPKTQRTLSFPHEYFTTRVSGKIVSSCIITYPRLSPNKFTEDGRKAFSIYTGGEELFSDKDDNFVKIYDVKSRKGGKGYGKLLFEKLKEYLKSKGKMRIYIDVDKENLGAHEFYKKVGFEKKYDGVFVIGYVLNFK